MRIIPKEERTETKKINLSDLPKDITGHTQKILNPFSQNIHLSPGVAQYLVAQPLVLSPKEHMLGVPKNLYSLDLPIDPINKLIMEEKLIESLPQIPGHLYQGVKIVLSTRRCIKTWTNLKKGIFRRVFCLMDNVLNIVSLLTKWIPPLKSITGWITGFSLTFFAIGIIIPDEDEIQFNVNIIPATSSSGKKFITHIQSQSGLIQQAIGGNLEKR